MKSLPKHFSGLPTMAALLIYSLLSFGQATAQTQLWGVSQAGGPDDIGTLFSLLDDGSAYTSHTDFLYALEGRYPKTSLVANTNGLYGITAGGGTDQAGAVFRYDDGQYHHLADLQADLHGSNSRGGFVDVDGQTFVATTYEGAANGVGALISFDTDEGLSVLAAFDLTTTGGNPTGPLYMDEATQTIYGTCSGGGSGNAGTVYAYHLSDESLEVIHVFDLNTDGIYPQGGVILAEDGLLYGTAQSGGQYGQGALFSLNPETGAYAVEYDFNNAAGNGQYPYGALLESSPGVLLGTCSEGGGFATGTVFKYSVGGAYEVLKSLNASVDGSYSKTGLVPDGQGAFVGLTEFGGAFGFGTLFSITEDGGFTKLHDFDYTAHGSNPVARMTLAVDGTLYGVCASGGAADFGTLFSLSSSVFAKAHDFSLPLLGAGPQGLLSGGDDSFLGISRNGGTANNGVFFSADAMGQTQKLHDFYGPIEGREPDAGLVYWDSLYVGAARFGGLDEAGTVFGLDAAGELTLIHTFSADGQGRFPFASPTAHSDGNLYGTTSSGGDSDDGTIYRIDTAMNYTTLYSLFSFYDGAVPEAGLTEGSDNLLYGLTTSGGNFNQGTLFSFDPATNLFTVVHHFDPSTEGGAPRATMMLHSDGKLYGTTSEEALGGGALFRYSALEGFELLHALQPDTDGSTAVSPLAEALDGTVFGFATLGGQYGQGSAFKYSDVSGFESFYSFQAPEVAQPKGAPVLGYPECTGDDDCTPSPCAVAYCVNGHCEQTPINPQFTALQFGNCQPETSSYELTLSLALDASPGGQIVIAGQPFALDPDQTEYTFVIADLPANGQTVALPYYFESGCNGETGILGNAPEACSPLLITFVVDLGGVEPGNQGVFIGGNFQGWSPYQNPMAEVQPGIWEATLGMTAGDIEFNFFNGPSIFDVEYVIGDCDLNGKRLLTVGETSDTLAFCWGLCVSECPTDGLGNYIVRPTIRLVPNLIGRGESMRVELNTSAQKPYPYRIIDAAGRAVDIGMLPASGRAEIRMAHSTSGMYTFLVLSQDGMPLAAARFAVY